MERGLYKTCGKDSHAKPQSTDNAMLSHQLTKH